MIGQATTGADWQLGGELPAWLAPFARSSLAGSITLLQAHALQDVLPLVRQVWQASLDGAWCCGFIGYEAAAAFDEALPAISGHSIPQTGGSRPEPPLACFLVSRHLDCAPENLTAKESFDFTQPWLMAGAVAQDDASSSIQTVRQSIEQGRYYQLNLTATLHARGNGDPRALFARFARMQPAMLGFCIRTPDWAVISASPELFFQWDGDTIQTRPMKGTAAPSGNAQQDRERLVSSDKDRAENVMIVDLLRNDLSRVAMPGSVSVPSLFDVQTHPTVVQMTSTVQARTRPGITLEGVLKALFPCGSVTGAPKHEAMRHLAELEGQPRGVYCGAVGLLAPGGKALFNVAIRTAVHHRASGQLRYGVGSGLTWYSDAGAEWEEWQWKTRIAHRTARAFCILETVGLQQGVWLRCEQHLSRMQKSAHAFAYAFDRSAILQRLQRAASEHPSGSWRGRWLLDADGQLTVEVHPVDELPLPLTLQLAEFPMDVHAGDLPFVQHKTNWRVPYDRHKSALPDAPDVLMRGSDGALLETARGNLVMENAAGLWTPDSPWQLPGVLQAQLLSSGQVRACHITLEMLQGARAVWVVNSLRGWMPVSCVLDHHGQVMAQFEPVFRVSSAL